MNIITIDKTQPEFAEALADCEVGVPKTLTLTVVPVTDTDDVFVATVDSVEYSEQLPEEEEAPVEQAERAYRPRSRSGSATAVEPMV